MTVNEIRETLIDDSSNVYRIHNKIVVKSPMCNELARDLINSSIRRKPCRRVFRLPSPLRAFPYSAIKAFMTNFADRRKGTNRKLGVVGFSAHTRH